MESIQGVSAYNAVSTQQSNYNQVSSYSAASAQDINPFGNDAVGVLLHNSDKLANYIAGGFNANKHGATVGAAFKNITKDFGGTMQTTFKASLAGAGLSAVVVGAAEGWEQAVLLSQGNTTLGRATAGIIGAGIQGAAGGAGSVIAGGLSNLLAAGLGLGGTPLAIVTMLGGAVGGAFAAYAVNTAGIESKIRSVIE